MTESDNFYNRIPKSLIYISFIPALLLDFIPLANHLYWLPEFSAMMLMYWLINRPQDISIGCAFLLGILVDTATGSPLAQHALAYIFSAYFITRYRRYIVNYHYGMQAVAIWAALLCNELLLSVVHMRFSGSLPDWSILIAPFIGALLWPMLNKIMVSILNLRYLRR